MNIFFPLFVFLSFQHTNNLQESSRKSDLEGNGLKGRIKQVKENVYKAEDKLGVIVQGEKLSSPLSQNYIAKYDSRGNTIEWLQDDRVNDNERNHKFTYQYDEQGNKLERKGYKFDGTLDAKWTYKYDKKGILLEENIYSPEGVLQITTKSTYNENGNKIEESSVYSNGSLNNKELFKYDEKGNLIELNRNSPWDSLNFKGAYCCKVYHYTYDDKSIKTSGTGYDSKGNISFISKFDSRKNLIESNSYNKVDNKNIEYKTVYKYDDKRNVVEEKYDSSDGSFQGRIFFKYDYDKQNNWIKKIELESDIPKSITIREITYF